MGNGIAAGSHHETGGFRLPGTGFRAFSAVVAQPQLLASDFDYL